MTPNPPRTMDYTAEDALLWLYHGSPLDAAIYTLEACDALEDYAEVHEALEMLNHVKTMLRWELMRFGMFPGQPTYSNGNPVQVMYLDAGIDDSGNTYPAEYETYPHPAEPREEDEQA